MRYLGLILLASMFIPNMAQAKDNKLPQYRWVEHSSVSGSDVHLYYNIDKSRFTSSGVGGTPNTTYSIPKSGYYLFTENCVATTISSPTNASMLYVGQANTVIDLGSCAIGESTGSATLDVIVIAADNVTIKNGTICAANKGAAIRVTQGVKDVKLQNLTIRDCLTEGIHIDGNTGAGNDVHNVHIRNCTVQDVSASAAVVGVLAEFTDDLLLENIVVSNVASTGAACDGVKLDNCSRAKLSNIEVTNCSSTTSGTVNGIQLTQTTISEIENCRIMGNSSAGIMYSIYLTNASTGNLIKNCDIIKNSGANLSEGILIDDSTADSDYNTVDGCKVINQVSTSTTGSQDTYGFNTSGCDGTYFMNCVARGCVSTTNNSTYGISLAASSTLCHIENCKSSDHTSAVTAYGINVADGVVDSVIMRNETFNNIGTTSGYGINDANSTSYSLYQRNVAYRNMASGGAVTNYNVASGGNTENFQVKSASITNFTAYTLSDPIYNFEILTG